MRALSARAVPAGPAGLPAAGRTFPLLLAAILVVGAIALGGAGPTEQEESGSCLTGDCHADVVTARRVHRPVAEGVCGICHRRISDGGHDFRLARDASDLCAFCHREIGVDRHGHTGLSSDGCLLCHDPHGSDNPKLLPTARVSELCEECHADVLIDRTVIHTPVLIGPCTACHDPHVASSDEEAADRAGRCLQCHELLRTELATARKIHDPLRRGGCGECHDAHGSTSGASLVADVPRLCYRCHEGIRDQVSDAAHGHIVAGQPGGCTLCHDPHASSVGSGLQADPLTLCGACHASEVTTDEGDVLAATVQEITSSEYQHGPVRQRDCGACHDSHGSDHFRLLRENYAAEFYAGFDLDLYALCFSCHPQRKVLTERTTTLTGFRNGDLNLHYLHVNKPKNGRTCRACHATHASNQPKHIRESVPFGQWELPIRFEETPTGGRCEPGCHRPRAYDRESPLDYGMSTPAGGKGAADVLGAALKRDATASRRP
jgi:predicted CXXCH cytochrome family protein